MKLLLVLTAALIGNVSAIVLRKNHDRNSKVHIQDDLGRFRFGYQANEVNGAIHARNDFGGGGVNHAYNRGSVQYGVQLGHPLHHLNKFEHSYYPDHPNSVAKTNAEVNWHVSSSQQIPPHHKVPTGLYHQMHPMAHKDGYPPIAYH